MLEPDIEIAKISEETQYNKDFSRTGYIRVEFHVGKHGPFVQRFQKDGFTADIRDQGLNAFAQEVR
jgi:hypothetical protein